MAESDKADSDGYFTAGDDDEVTTSQSGDSDSVKDLKGSNVNSFEAMPPEEEIVFGTDESSSFSEIQKNRSGQNTANDSIDFLQDPEHEMTWGRRIALGLMKYKWYNPQIATPKDEKDEPQEIAAEATASESLRRRRPAPPSGKKAASNVNRSEPGELVRANSSFLAAEAYPFSRATRETPSLERAWAYFDHVALPRCVVPPSERNKAKSKNIFTRVLHRFQKADKRLDRAEPGEKTLPTRLYRPVFTPHKQLGDWGLGIGLYFSTLRAITIMTFLAGILNIPNFMYFSSDEYNENPLEDVSKRLLGGSAICTDTTWIPCPSCNENDKHFGDGRIGVGINLSTGEETTFARRNNCDGTTIQTGMVSLATFFFLILGMFVTYLWLQKMTVAFDEDEQTAQDYSVVVLNPPGDATDAAEWRKFFFDRFDGALLTVCTIAVDNDLLVRCLVERREKLRQLEMMVEDGTSLDVLTLSRIAAKQERERRFFGRLMASISPGIPELFARLVVLTAKIQGLAQQDYPASKIFLTFEREADQRRVLSALNVGSIPAKRNKISKISNPQHLFRDQFLLHVKEPDEPDTVRWQDLNEKFKERMKQQALTTFCTIGAVALIAFIVRLCNDSSVTGAAYAIAIFNTVFPMVAKFLTSFEAHASEGSKQRSLYFKIALFRWVNTAIVITVITPFTLTLENEDGLISQIYALFFAEIVTTTGLQLADPVGHLQRHILAPRAKTQDAMNLCMQGQPFELAERYTNMTKILFLTVFYLSIFPGALFLCSFALFVNYFTDRFSLMRTWKRAPNYGPRMSEFSRTYFIPCAMVACAVMGSYFWSGFPFDNLCNRNTEIGQEFAGSWLVDPKGGGSNVTVSVATTDDAFDYCLQDFFRYGRDDESFPFISKFQKEQWMTDEQETVTDVWGWTSVGVILLVVLKLLRGWWSSFWHLFKGSYEPCGQDQKINFSEVPSISAYVPQVESNLFSYPLVACEVDEIDPNLFDWTDPDRPFSFYDLTKDAEVLLKGTDVASKFSVFSQITHWSPLSRNSRKSSEQNIEDC
uniref:CSC1/OSCA1-like cytosolic domain-containing protein n=1 Tax=Entomoneis paludosa TaxID=265537 RepID=A0A7S2YHU2_9STRA|mmetsp:Transcript_33260/g.69285  ORF Transcript_33260/g.69285 Transcript_33260/m.69285 type:complete len:1045 (+) Transcript_33260:144-3278(+)